MSALAWGLVPARGGSKSIPYKNLVPLAGRPMLDYGVRAAQKSGRLARLFGSTDDDRIAARFAELGVEVDRRPTALATDDAAVADVARDFLIRRRQAGDTLPEILALVQPTSPFLRPSDIVALLDRMAVDKAAQSGQTITPVPHNHHAWNQRWFKDGRTGWVHAEERAKGINKQSKPKHWVFGNLVAARVEALLGGADFFAQPSSAVEILPPHDFDLDGPTDIAMAEALIAARAVALEHIP